MYISSSVSHHGGKPPLLPTHRPTTSRGIIQQPPPPLSSAHYSPSATHKSSPHYHHHHHHHHQASSSSFSSRFNFAHLLLVFAIVFFILNFFIFFIAFNNNNSNSNNDSSSGNSSNGGILSYVVEHKFLNHNPSNTLTQLLEAMKKVDEGLITSDKLLSNTNTNANTDTGANTGANTNTNTDTNSSNNNNDNNNNSNDNSQGVSPPTVTGITNSVKNEVKNSDNSNDQKLTISSQQAQKSSSSSSSSSPSLVQQQQQQQQQTKEQTKEQTKQRQHYYIERYPPKKPSHLDEHMIRVEKRTTTTNDNNHNNVGCDHTLDRDYSKDPIRVTGLFSGPWKNCAIPCVGNGGGHSHGNRVPDVTVGSRMSHQKSCAHTKHFTFTMENVGMDSMKHGGDSSRTLVGTTRLNSDIPVPYYSWAEYNYMMPLRPKTAKAMMAVFISNCSAQKRLNILQDLIKYGVTVHSFGRCMHNAQIPQEFMGGYLDQKTAVTATYKFTFAAENSETVDYVTEKLFGTLSAGSVPVYLGAPNVMKFAPSAKSIINISSFNSTKELADYLLMLDRDDAKYQEYLQWKIDGPSDDFKAVVDRAIVHSSCRLCIRVADYQRAMYGANMVGHETRRVDTIGNEKVLGLRVRPRGEFYMKYVYLTGVEERNLQALYDKVLQAYADHVPAPGQVHSIFRLWDRLERPIEDADFRNGVLEQDMELEIIFTYPIHPERGDYYKWQQRTGRAPEITAN